MDFDDDFEVREIDVPSIDFESARKAVYALITAVGEDPEREGLKNTPERVARMYAELLSGYNMDAEQIINGALFEINYDEMVLVRDIEFYSLCEHHMLPFLGRAHVAYLPKGRVIGLSKIGRILEMFSVVLLVV
jgi:GTP cyclohydrolase I